MEIIRMSILVVSSKEETYHGLRRTLQTVYNKVSPFSLPNTDICYFTIVQNVDQLVEKIISTVDSKTTDVVLIVGPDSLKNNITNIIFKVKDTKNKIGTIFAEIPALFWSKNIDFQWCTCRNNTLIFFMIGNKKEIKKYVRVTAPSIVLGAYLLQLTINYKNKCNILDRPQMEEDKILYTHHSGLFSPLDLSLYIGPNQPVDKNVSTNQETHQSTVSVERALSLIRQTIMEHNITPESEYVYRHKALRRFLSDSLSVTSSMDVPLFSSATKQEYASSKISSVDARSQVEKEEHIPLGATAVISAENVVCNDEAGLLNKSTSHSIKFPGRVIEKGKSIINKFTLIGSKELTLLAACGYNHIKVLKKLLIGVLTIGELTIGNELQESKQIELKHLHNCNRVFLITLLKENGFDCNILDCGIANISDVMNTVRKIGIAVKTVDLLVITGCNNDIVKIILKRFATIHFENVDMEPGASTVFASCSINDKTKIILRLPGNPASVFMTAHVFFLPLVNWIHRNFKESRPTISAKLEQKLLLDSCPRYVWATLSWNKKERIAKVTCKKEKFIYNNLSNIISANVLLRLPQKTLENSTLKVPLSVPATLIKFSN